MKTKREITADDIGLTFIAIVVTIAVLVFIFAALGSAAGAPDVRWWMP